jgi:cobalt/nickel transport protein
MRTRTFVVVGVVAALLLAGVVSFYASSSPDGLEYVAEKTGFLDAAEEHPARDSPFADYGTRGVENERLSGGIAGVVGSLVVLALAGGLGYAVRRRGSAADPDAPTPMPTAGSGSAASAEETSPAAGKDRHPADRA